MALAAKQNGAHPIDDVSEAVSRAVSGVEGIKVERDRLRQLLTDSDKAGAMKDGEMSAQGREIANLRYRLSYYQNFATTLAAHFNSILAHVEEALKASVDAAQHAAKDQRERGMDVADFEVPSFLQRWQDEEEARRAAS